MSRRRVLFEVKGWKLWFYSRKEKSAQKLIDILYSSETDIYDFLGKRDYYRKHNKSGWENYAIREKSGENKQIFQLAK